MVSIIDYGLGNLASVKKTLDFLGVENQITSSKNIIEESKFIILPGVGSFKQGMDNLNSLDLIKTLTKEVIQNRKPFLGICLGMQLLFESSEEAIGVKGLGWVKGHVKKIKDGNYRVPHMGWNEITCDNKLSIMKDSEHNDFYFIHSYHCVPQDASIITSKVMYGEDLVSSIQLNSINAMQFHPEKSQEAGLILLKRFFSENA